MLASEDWKLGKDVPKCWSNLHILLNAFHGVFVDGFFLELLIVAFRKWENIGTGSVRLVGLFFPSPCWHVCCI